MRWVALIAVAALLLAFGLGGAAPFGRVLMALGANRLAAPLVEDPDWKGAACYRARDMACAAHNFGTAGAQYNLGTALARQADYAAALEAYDRVIPAGDEDARANFDLIVAYYAALGIDPEVLGLFTKRTGDVEEDSFVAQGNARAAGMGDEVTNSSAMLGLVELQSREQQGVRRVFDDRFMVADERWLQQLSDVPGDFLAARIGFEHKRRAKLGLTPPDPEDRR